jgi:hypothetical protein
VKLFGNLTAVRQEIPETGDSAETGEVVAVAAVSPARDAALFNALVTNVVNFFLEG